MTTTRTILTLVTLSFISLNMSGQIILKSNPISFLWPEYNGLLEVGLTEKRSLELKLAYYPGAPQSNFASPVFPSSFVPNYTAHLMLRHKLHNKAGLFFSYGLMLKTWKYENLYVHPFDRWDPDPETFCYYEDRNAVTPGLRGMAGFRLPMFEERFVLEPFMGYSFKLQIASGERRFHPDCPLSPPVPTRYHEVKPGGGFLLGINLGVVLFHDVVVLPDK